MAPSLVEVELFFVALSAVGGIFGYFVQARNARREEARQMRLARVREKLSVFVGPASVRSLHLCTTHHQLVRHARDLFPAEMGALDADRASRDETWTTYFAGAWNLRDTFVGPDLEALCRREPDHAFARTYRIVFRGLVRDCAEPLAALIAENGGHLQDFEDEATFARKWPCVDDPMGRNLFFTQFLAFAAEARGVVDAWDAGDLSGAVFPRTSPCPMQICWYLCDMAARLRKLETHYGLDSHKVSGGDVVKERVALVRRASSVQADASDGAPAGWTKL